MLNLLMARKSLDSPVKGVFTPRYGVTNPIAFTPLKQPGCSPKPNEQVMGAGTGHLWPDHDA